MSTELDTLCAVLRSAANSQIMPRFRGVASRSKADGSLVTEADLAAQRVIIDLLSERFPGVPVLGEEMTADEQRALMADADSGIWCLDPLDGTSNYAGGLPFFSVSLSLVKDGQVQRGAILDPSRDECFCAERGCGAYLNGELLQLPARDRPIADALAVVDLKRLPPRELHRFGGAAPYRSQRSLGSVALEWCWLAAGRCQLYLHGGQRLWDYGAGRLIATEAGVLSNLYPQPGRSAVEGLSLDPRMAVAAADRDLMEQWLDWLGPSMVGDRGF